ncbi:MAG: protein-glutamate O-methyltransferase CheR [Nitrospirae bacterium]|nr:protein-glutamate O-methyltransferase CheR [Nitrospirota bacterium]
MFETEKIIPLTDDVFRLLRDSIKDYCGIYFDDNSKYLLEKRLSKRVRSHSLEDFRDYYRLLLYDKKKGEEFAFIVDVLTVNETYFFREMNQLRTLSEEILPELKDKNRGARKIRIWSAGCSTGEEPYTIAMLILEHGYFLGWDIEILGSDINQRVLQYARRGVYRKNSFRTTDEYFMKKYFTKEDNLYIINDNAKRFVNFSCLNLLDPFKIKFVGNMDVILCRNVLIYFDLDSRKKVIHSFHERLVDGGYLLMGHAESIMNISTAFTLKHFKNDMVYQKPQGTAAISLSENSAKFVGGNKV